MKNESNVHPYLKARKMTNYELRRQLAYKEGTSERAAAEVEIERRKFWRDFFTHGIIAWIAIGISICSFAVSVYVNFFKG